MTKKVELLNNEARAEVVRRGLTLGQVAQNYGCGRVNLTNVMAKRYITEETAKKLAAAIGVPVEKITKEIEN